MNWRSSTRRSYRGKLQETGDEVQKFRGMIHNANPTLIAQKMQGIAFAKVIETFPLWVGPDAPSWNSCRSAELFDLVVVDEASQVNIAEIIPAFVAARAHLRCRRR